MIKHFLTVLLKENLLGFLLVCVTMVTVTIQAYTTAPFEAIRLLPIAFPFIYAVVHLRNTGRLAKQTYNAVPVPYSVCLGQTHEWFESALRQQEQKLTSLRLAWADIQRTFHIHRMDWAYFDEHRLSLDGGRWNEKVREINRHFDHLTNRIPIQPVYHVFLAVPGTLAFAMGAKFGRRIPVVVYQHAGMVRDPYVAVFDTENIGNKDGYHLLNQRVTEYSRLEIETIQSPVKQIAKTVLLVLDFTGHELRKPYPDCGANQTIHVRLKGSRGHIPLDGNWVEIAHEVASLVFQYLDSDHEVHILPGIPAALAFVLGTIVGTTPGIRIYHFNVHDSAYTSSMALHEI